MRVFVTGGSGFVGGHVIEALAPKHEVRAMARSARSAEAVSRYGATAASADLDAIAPEHLAGCDAVVRCAAYVEEWGTREQFWEGNVEGTTRMLAANADGFATLSVRPRFEWGPRDTAGAPGGAAHGARGRVGVARRGDADAAGVPHGDGARSGSRGHRR